MSASYESQLNDWVNKEKLGVDLLNSVGTLMYDKGIELILFRNQLLEIGVSELMNSISYANNVVNRKVNIETAAALANEMLKLGLKCEGIYFYHFHALPPVFEELDPLYFRKLSWKLENPNDWRGYLLASAFIIDCKSFVGSRLIHSFKHFSECSFANFSSRARCLHSHVAIIMSLFEGTKTPIQAIRIPLPPTCGSQINSFLVR